MIGCDTSEVVDWLVDGARSASELDGVLGRLCDRLLDCGIPIWRAGLFVLTLHPQIMGQRFLWRPGAPVDVNNAPFEAFQAEDFRHSPVRRVIDTGVSLRRKLADTYCPIDFAVIRDLQAQGATDYLAVPLLFADGAVHGATFATKEPRGFTDAQIAALESVVAPLTRVAENRTLQRVARTMLDTYVGNQGGSRILAGHIRRGDVDTINAAIWLSDMRGFTLLADRLPPQTLLDLLNRYFDCQVPSILDHGGEVLKFMGDGLLAIFAVAPGGENVRDVCDAALAAARAARIAIASFGAPHEHGLEGVRFGLALHLGQVLYGNIGSGNRLDFTCIGPAVNLAARIEKLTGKLGRTILASDEFARHCPSEFVPVGDFDLAGFASAQAVFGLEDESKSYESRRVLA
jgi:adenylate cyclase